MFIGYSFKLYMRVFNPKSNIIVSQHIELLKFFYF